MEMKQTKRGTVLSEQVMFAHVHVHQGSKTARDHESALRLAEAENADADLVNVSTALLKNAFPRSTYFANQIYQAHKRWTFRLPSNGGGQIKGPGILPTRLAEPYLDEISDLITQYEHASDEECASLPKYIQREKARLGAMFDPSMYPQRPEHMRCKFGASVHLDGLPKVEDLNAGAHTASQQAQAREREDAIANSIGKQILMQLLEHVAHLANVLDKEKGKIFPSLFDNVTQLVDVVIPCCDVASDPELDGIVKELRRVLIYDAKQVKATPSARKHVANGAKKIAKKIGATAKDRGINKSEMSQTVQNKVKAYF